MKRAGEKKWFWTGFTNVNWRRRSDVRWKTDEKSIQAVAAFDLVFSNYFIYLLPYLLTYVHA